MGSWKINRSNGNLMYFVKYHMFAFLRNWFNKMYYFIFPLKKKEIEITRNWNPLEFQNEEVVSILRTTGRSREMQPDFYKSDRTILRRSRWGLDSAYNTY